MQNTNPQEDNTYFDIPKKNRCVEILVGINMPIKIAREQIKTRCLDLFSVRNNVTDDIIGLIAENFVDMKEIHLGQCPYITSTSIRILMHKCYWLSVIDFT